MREQPEYTEYQIDKADEALDLMDSVVKNIVEIADQITMHESIEVSWKDWQRFIGETEDAVSELFHKERMRLGEIAGDRPEPESMMEKKNVSFDMVFEALNPSNNPFIPQPTRGMAPQNPETLKWKGEPL